jgi:hypothetical protein
MRKGALPVVGLVAVVTALTAAAFSPDAQPDPHAAKAGNPTPRDTVWPDPRMVRQASAEGVASDIDIAVRDHGLDGFTGLVVAPSGVTLHWKGTLPGEIKSIIEKAPVRVEVRSARFSSDEFLAASRNLFQHTPPEVTVELVGGGPTRDFAALEVQTTSPIPADQADALKTMAGDIPLRFTVGPRAVPLG